MPWLHLPFTTVAKPPNEAENIDSN